MSGTPPVLDDLAGGAHDLGRHKNEQQGVRVEGDRRIERAEKAGERDARREPGIGYPHRPELDQFVALVAWRLRVPRREDGGPDRQHDLVPGAL
jgi:hypothetical protein